MPRLRSSSQRRNTPAVTSMRLVGDQELTVENEGTRNLICLRSAGGSVALTIEVTADGPILRFDGPALAIQTSGPLVIDSESIALHGRRGVSLSSGGDAAIRITGDLEISARMQKIRADLGDVEVRANDDVRLVGERVLLNC